MTILTGVDIELPPTGAEGTNAVNPSTRVLLGREPSCTVTVSVIAPTKGSFLNTLAVGTLVTTINGTDLVSNTDAASATLTASVPVPTGPVPTLSEWAMILLAALFVLFGVAGMRRQTM